MRMRKKAHLDERMERQSGRLIQKPEEYRGNWRQLLPGCREVRLELGCGKGRFTVQTAQAEPDVLFVAVERVADAMVVAMERAQAAGADNVCFIDGDARALDQWFAPGEVCRVYLNFSDPWPSSQQSKRRLTHPDFLRLYARVLAKSGEIHFKTDNKDLFEWSLFQFPKAGYTLTEVTRDLHADGVNGVMTDYEEKFYREGKPICRCVAVKGDTLSARLELVKPQPSHETMIRAYRQAFLDAGEVCNGSSGLEGMEDYETWRTVNAVGANPGWVKGDTFIALDAEGTMVGIVNIRHELNEALERIGGHIGYSVHPDLRRRGYATEILALALDYCREKLRLERVLLCCYDDNAASARVILHFDPVLENKVTEPETGRLIRRYWIELK